MVEPVTGTLAKALVPQVVKGISAGVSSLWKYYNDIDVLNLPTITQSAEFAEYLFSQVEETLTEESTKRQELANFLASPEAACVVRSLVACHIGGRPVTDSDGMWRLYSESVLMYGQWVEEEKRSLYRLLVNSTDYLVDSARSRIGGEVARDDLAAISAIQIEALLRSIDHQLSQLSASGAAVQVEEVEQFFTEYRPSVMATLSMIQPPNLDGADLVPINDIYVAPRMTIFDSEREAENVDLEDLVQRPRVVLLGDPGGGKTTATLKITDALVKREMSTGEVGEYSISPFVVVLRDYGTFMSKSSGSIIDYISANLRAKHQMEVRPPVIRWLLLTGRAFIIFDGLDELLAVQDRKTVADAVSSFCSLYTSAHVLVTSRRIGYQQAPLPSQVFETVTLGNFVSSDVEEYVRKWFWLDKRLTEEEKQSAAVRFLQESSSVPDLRQNPLMLGLMCNIYRTESYIPRNRPDVYAKCARMLFDHWDRHRGLFQEFEFEAHIEYAIMHIANRIFSDGSLQSGATESVLVEYAADYLQEWQYENRARAESAARQFIQFCRGRAWVLTDVGITPDGEDLYQFTHRTFLEYFTAAHIEWVAESLPALLGDLLDDIKAGQSDVISQLALHMKAKKQRGGPDVVVRVLLAEYAILSQDESEEQAENVLSFVVRALAFLIVSPPEIRATAHELWKFGVTHYATVTSDDATHVNLVLRYVSEIARESRQVFAESFASEIRTEIESNGDGREYGCAVAHQFETVIGLPEASLPADVLEVLRLARSTMLEERRNWPWAASILFLTGDLTMEQVIDALSVDSVRADFPIPGGDGYYICPAERILAMVSHGEGVSETILRGHYQNAIELAEFLKAEAPFRLTTVENKSHAASYGVKFLRARVVDKLPEATDRLEVPYLVWRACGFIYAVMLEAWLTENFANEMAALECFVDVDLGDLSQLTILGRARISGHYDGLIDVEELAGGRLIEWAYGHFDFIEVG